MFEFDFFLVTSFLCRVKQGVKIEVGNAKKRVSTLVFKQVKLKHYDFVKVQRVAHLVAEASEV